MTEKPRAPRPPLPGAQMTSPRKAPRPKRRSHGDLRARARRGDRGAGTASRPRPCDRGWPRGAARASRRARRRSRDRRRRRARSPACARRAPGRARGARSSSSRRRRADRGRRDRSRRRRGARAQTSGASPSARRCHSALSGAAARGRAAALPGSEVVEQIAAASSSSDGGDELRQRREPGPVRAAAEAAGDGLVRRARDAEVEVIVVRACCRPAGAARSRRTRRAPDPRRARGHTR